MEDKSYISFRTDSTHDSGSGETEEANPSNRSVLGLPPNLTETEGEDNDSQDLLSDDDDDEEVPAPVNNEFAESEIYDDSCIDAERYTNDHVVNKVQSLLSAALCSDGLKLKSGYTADEVDAMAREMIGFNLESLTRTLIGDEGMSQIKNGAKVDFCRALERNGFLRFDTALFTYFPVVGEELTDLSRNIILGAESHAAFQETKKVQNQYQSAEDEIRAMRTYNMLVQLISAIADTSQHETVSYQEILDGYHDMIKGVSHCGLMKKYGKKEMLDLESHPVLNVEWFKHYTSRSSLKNFCSMEKYSSIWMDNSDKMTKFGVSKSCVTFEKKHFEEVIKKWSAPDDKDRVRERPPRRREQEPDPNYQPRNLTVEGDDDDFFEPGRPTTSTRPTDSYRRNRSESPMLPPRPPVGNFGGFGVLPNDINTYRPSSPDAFSPSRSTPQHLDLDYSDSEVSPDTEGEYSDEDESEKLERKKKKELKVQKKMERDRLKREQRSNSQPQVKPNRFDKSTFNEEETTTRRRSTSSTRERTLSGSIQDETKREDSEDEVSVRTDRSTKFDSNCKLPLNRSFVDNSGNLSTIYKQPKRPQLPHEPSADQMIKNKQEQLEQSIRRAEKKKQQEEYERRQREERERAARKRNERDVVVDEEERLRRRAEEKQKLMRTEEEEMRRFEQIRRDAELARMVEDEERRSASICEPSSSMGPSHGRKTVLNKQRWDPAPENRAYEDYRPPTNSSRTGSDPAIDRSTSIRSPLPISDELNHSRRSAFREPLPRYGEEQMRSDYAQMSMQQPPIDRRIPPAYPRAYPPNHPVQQPHYDPSYRPQSSHSSAYVAQPPSNGYPYGRNDMNHPRSSYAPQEPVYPNNYRPDIRYGPPPPSHGNTHSYAPTPVVDPAMTSRLISRITFFIQEMEADGLCVTDTVFYQKYPYELPTNFSIGRFVDDHMADRLTIKRIQIGALEERMYSLIPR